MVNWWSFIVNENKVDTTNRCEVWNIEICLEMWIYRSASLSHTSLSNCSHFVNHLSIKYSNALNLKIINILTYMRCYLSHLKKSKDRRKKRYKNKKLFIRLLITIFYVYEQCNKIFMKIWSDPTLKIFLKYYICNVLLPLYLYIDIEYYFNIFITLILIFISAL